MIIKLHEIFISALSSTCAAISMILRCRACYTLIAVTSVIMRENLIYYSASATDNFDARLGALMLEMSHGRAHTPAAAPSNTTIISSHTTLIYGSRDYILFLLLDYADDSLLRSRCWRRLGYIARFPSARRTQAPAVFDITAVSSYDRRPKSRRCFHSPHFTEMPFYAAITHCNSEATFHRPDACRHYAALLLNAFTCLSGRRRHAVASPLAAD